MENENNEPVMCSKCNKTFENEVDFIVYGPLGFFAFEIKRSSSVNYHDAKGLRSFQKDYPEARLYLLHGGDKEYFFDDR